MPTASDIVFDKEYHYTPIFPIYVKRDGSVRFDERHISSNIGEDAPNKFESMESANNFFLQKMGHDAFHKKSLCTLNRYFKQYLMNAITEPHKVQIIDSLYEKLVQVPYSGLPKQALIKKSHIVLKLKTISFCDIVECLEENQWTCGYSGMSFDTNHRHLCPSIDRIDSTKGYVKGNIAIVLTCLNMAKSTLTFDDFKTCVGCIAAGSITETPPILDGVGVHTTKPCQILAQVSLDLPLRMKSQIEAKLFYEFRDRDWFLWKDAVRELGLKEDSRQCLKRLQGGGYLQRLGEGTKMKPFSYKFKTREEIIEVNENKTFTCTVCHKSIPVKDAAPRKTRQADATYDGNFYFTLCRKCFSNATIKSRRRDFATRLWSLIRARKDKHGDISKDNVHLIVSDTCAISGVPLCVSCDGVVPFNSVSPDRLNSSGRYDISNTRCVCVMLNYMKKDYDISDVEIMSIIKTCDAFLNRPKSILGAEGKKPVSDNGLEDSPL